ncbi:MAG: DUF4276 family protein [Verrucomicrobiaceae bacterium]|nr:MAG: DUF4276 family protein [Verrucomicrobiaceae bacterium]
MAWLRLYITVEGQAEKAFADLALTPHLANYNIEVKPRVVLTNRKLGKRGGILDFDRIRGDLMRLMKQDQHPEARFTTMIDLYALPAEFPGWEQARRKNNPLDRVSTLEQALYGEFPDPRFHPYIQLHEFEALLFCGLGELQARLPNSASAITALQQEVAHLESEAINEGPHTAPSKRIIHHLPIYERTKVRVGAPAAAAIGLSILRSKCPHFAQWLAKLEKLS